MINQRFLFPAIYPLFLLPTFSSSVEAKLFVLLMCPCLAFLINFRSVSRIVALLLAALLTLVPMLSLVQTAVCTSPIYSGSDSLLNCIVQRSAIVLLNVCTLSATFLLAAANEWRGSLVATVNGMCLPRQIRVMAIVSAAMIGGFRRSMFRVHHAFTARGEAMPALHWRNLIVLPTMLGAVWASELNGIVMRAKGQWSSDAFWRRYVPSKVDHGSVFTFSDGLVLIASVLLFGVWLISADLREPRKFF